MTLLQVKNLKTHFALHKSWRPSFIKPATVKPATVKPAVVKPVLKAVDGVSFSIAEGEVLSLVGESGCGKSTLGRTLTRLEDATDGSATFMGVDILKLSKAEFKPIRRHIQMIFQDPFASLNPRLTIEQTLTEPLRIHNLVKSRSEAQQKITEILSKVGLDPTVMQRHPHEFSGGQRQRIGIARVMILSPSLIIADEPVSALDVSIQAQVLNLIKRIQQDHGVAMLFISHDLGVVRYVSDRVAVMYLGHIVEIGKKSDIFSRSSHPYTRLLLQSIPPPDPLQPRQPVAVIGEPGNAADPPVGCVFHPRCWLASDICRSEAPPLVHLSQDHQSACHHIDQLPKNTTT